MRTILYCLLSSLFTLCHVAQADSSNVTIDLLRYDLIDETLTASVRGDSKLVQEVFIPNKVKHEGETYTVTTVANAGFYDYLITSVRLPTTLKGIGGGAFMYNSLTSVKIPGSVAYIANDAFNFNELTSVTIPDSVTYIGERAFGFNKLTSVTIPDSVTYIGPYAFEWNVEVINGSVVGGLTSVRFEGDYQTGFAATAFEDNRTLTLIEACDKASGWEDKSFVKETVDGTTNTIPVTLSAYACATPPSLPIWLLWVGAGACNAPGAAITDNNFSAAITDWLDKGNTSQYGDITRWCTGNVTDMSNAFNGLESTEKANFNADISGWNTSRVTNMNNMFRSNTAFSQDISNWDTSRVTTMRFMFERAAVFNRNIGGWKTGAVTDMNSMFAVAGNFNQNIGGWDTSKVTDMSNMFIDADNFNQDISSWNVSAVKTMFQMFRNAEKFNQNLSEWSVAGDLDCFKFAGGATDWKAEYGGSMTGKTPPLSPSMIAAGCNSD